MLVCEGWDGRRDRKKANKELEKENQKDKVDWRKAKEQEGEERETKDLRDNRKEKK